MSLLFIIYLAGAVIAAGQTYLIVRSDGAARPGIGWLEQFALVIVPCLLGAFLWPMYVMFWLVSRTSGWITDRFKFLP